MQRGVLATMAGGRKVLYPLDSPDDWPTARELLASDAVVVAAEWGVSSGGEWWGERFLEGATDVPVVQAG